MRSDTKTETSFWSSSHTASRDTCDQGTRLLGSGGDEFGVILTDEGDPETILAQLRELIELEVQVSGLPVSIESSIGFAVAPDDGLDVDELMQRADVAMYLAKFEHSGTARYDAASDTYDAANLGLIAELRRAISEDELVLHYQPKARVSDGRIDALEALVRWQHPTLGLLPPDRFVPLAEPTDLIERLTEWVLARAITDIRDLGPDMEHVAVAVNVSARSLGRQDFAERVIDTLDVLGVDHRRLIVEITETALLVDPPACGGGARRLGLGRSGGEHRRLRRRPDLARLSVVIAPRGTQDRPQLRRRHPHERRAPGHRAIDRGSRPQPGISSRG